MAERSAECVIKALEKALSSAPAQSRESFLQKAFQDKLTELGVKFERPFLQSTDGSSRPDILILETSPSILIEIKSSGKWPYVAAAAAQLYGYARLLAKERDVEVLKLAIFGTQPQNDNLEGYLEKLGVRYLYKG